MNQGGQDAPGGVPGHDAEDSVPPLGVPTGDPTRLVRSAVGRWVILRPVLPPDYPVLYSWSADLRHMYLWSHDRRVPAYQEFVSRIESSIQQTQSYTILERAAEVPIGFCQAYDINLSEG